MVFNGKAVPWTRNEYKVGIAPNGQYILRAGAAHGVSAKAEFTLYTDAKAHRESEPFGVCTVQDIKPFQSTLSQPISASNTSRTLGNSAIAIQTRVGVQEELRVHIPVEEGLFPVFNEALLMQIHQPSSSPQFRFALVDRSGADLEVRREGDDIVFGLLDQRVISHGLTRCIFKAKPDPASISQVIQGAAHYYYHLNRSYLTRDNLRESMTIEFMKLQPVWNYDVGISGWMPVGENLIKDGMITLDIDDTNDNLYGIRVTNRGAVNLYPNIFYFDNSELSIGECTLTTKQSSS